MNAKVTISRRSNTKSEGCISISIEDEKSGLRVVEVEMELSEFAESVTGLGYCSAKYRFSPTKFTVENIKKNREVKSIYVDKPKDVYDRDKERKIIAKSIIDSGELVDGWAVHDDGTSSQQPGDKHRVNLKRFV